MCIRSLLFQIESCPHETVANMIIGDFLYGGTDEDVRKTTALIVIFVFKL